MKSIIVAFIGGPHTGKTVAALKMTAALKCRGVSAEMARECIKHWAFEKRAVAPLDEIWITAKQIKEESLLFGQVRFIVTDRPVLVSVPFVDLYAPEPIRVAVRAMVAGYYKQLRADGHSCAFILLQRGKSYDQRGRWENRSRAELIDNLIEQALGEFGAAVYRSSAESAVRTALSLLPNTRS